VHPINIFIRAINFMNPMKKLSMAVAGVACISLGAAYTNAPAASAAIVAVGDSSSWVTGSNAISNLGYNMVTVADDPSVPGGFTPVTTLSSPVGSLAFDSPVQKAYIGSGWNTWSNGYTGEVYYNGGDTTLTIALPSSIVAFDLYVEPTAHDLFEIAVTAVNGTTTSLSQFVSGKADAKYFGFYATDEDTISSITIADKSGGLAAGFAIGQLRVASVPEPLTVGGTLVALGFGLLMRKKMGSSRGN
jgi:hypothetical protein